MKKEYLIPQCEVTCGEMETMIAASTFTVEDDTPDGEYEGRVREFNDGWDIEW